MNKLSMIAGVLLLSACATAPERTPDWVNGRTDSYAEARYLIGRGQADSAAVARDRARADLVKVFGADIAEESRDRSSATRESSGDQVKQSSAATVERNVSVTTGRTVEGIEIAEVWQDPALKIYHALAVLDRLKSGQALRAEIEQLDALTERELQRSRESDDLLRQIAAALRATEAQRQRAPLQRDLRVVDPTAVGIPPRWELGRLTADLEQLSKRVRIGSHAADDPVGNLDALLAGAVARAGFSPALPEAAPYRLDAALSLDESQSGGWYWAKGTLELTLKDQEGNVRSSRRFPVKAAAQQASAARQRVLGEVDRLLRAQLREVVLGINP